ncbi:MAG: hypothetical protein R2712_16430 [Vicinamibacterales bacterium]
MDRFAKGIGALLILVLIKDWGFGLSWQQLSYASLTMMGLWIVTALRARREYLRTFRRSIEQQDVRPADLRLDSADLSTIETLLGELSHPDPRRVLYAMDMLEALDKRQLVTPLLLYDESADWRPAPCAWRATSGPTRPSAGCWCRNWRCATRTVSAPGRRAGVGHAARRGRRGHAAVSGSCRSQPGRDRGCRAGASSDQPADVDRAEETLKRGCRRHPRVCGGTAEAGGTRAGARHESPVPPPRAPALRRQSTWSRARGSEQRRHRSRATTSSTCRRW